MGSASFDKNIWDVSNVLNFTEYEIHQIFKNKNMCDHPYQIFFAIFSPQEIVEINQFRGSDD